MQKEAEKRGTFLSQRDFVKFLEMYEQSLSRKLVSVHKENKLVGAFELKALDVANAFFVSASASDSEVNDIFSEVINAEVASDKTLLARNDTQEALSAFK